MLKRFFVDNFKSHINTTFELEPINLLVGVNNSGKTNLCQAIKFLSATSRATLAEAARFGANEEWTLANVHLGKSTIEFRVEVDLEHDGEKYSFVYQLALRLLEAAAARESGGRIRVLREELTASGGNFTDSRLISNNEGRVQLLDENKKRQVQTNAPVDATMLNRLYDLKDNPRANLFKRYLSSWLYYDLDSQQLRRPEAKFLDYVLASDGSNLASVLFNLKNANERVYRKLIDLTREIMDPDLAFLSFFSPAEGQVFMFAEDSAGHRFSPWSMSNGTLRFMSLAYIFMTQQTSAEMGAPRLIMIEEPETGIYVRHLKRLFSLVSPSAGNGQFLFTSQSPYFIDLFDGLLGGITVARRGEKSTQLVKPDQNRLRQRLDDMPLGELHYRELLT